MMGIKFWILRNTDTGDEEEYVESTIAMRKYEEMVEDRPNAGWMLMAVVRHSNRES